MSVANHGHSDPAECRGTPIKKMKSKAVEIDSRITPQAKRDAHIHYIVAFCGGFLTVFPLENIVKSFGSSQTTHLIEMVRLLIGKDWFELGLRFAGVLIFALPIFFVTYAKEHTKINVKYLALLVDVAMGFLMWLMPTNWPKVVYLYPTFFAMSLQWSSFSGSYGYAASTNFCTNNFKQTISALTEYFCNGKNEFKLKAQFYGAVLAGYYLGIFAGFKLFEKLGNFCFTLVTIPCAIIAVLIATFPKDSAE
ncbi:YoaK family protein [Treponema berlinense]|uniref:YoaK family protein n=1 Tax=Treponema berlinense TaxID=225004 RepID=UPI0023547AD4|nr:YoaK family protein [Treponema berlinense]